jgi:hypothetical protein
MFDTKEENAKAVDALYSASADLVRGDVLQWAVVESTTGLTRESHRLWHVVRRFRKRLRKERGIACRPITNVGLRLLTESEQVRRCSEDRHRKMFRQSTIAMREIEAVVGENLSLVDRRLRLFSMDRLREERKQIRSAVKQIATVRKSETMPLRKSPTV